MFSGDSPLLIVSLEGQKIQPKTRFQIDQIREKEIVPLYTLATVFVNTPGNLSDPARRKRLNSMINDLESLPESWGPETTNYFMRDFIEFEQSGMGMHDESESMMMRESSSIDTAIGTTNRTERFNLDDLPVFLNWPEYSFWQGFLRMETDSK